MDDIASGQEEQHICRVCHAHGHFKLSQYTFLRVTEPQLSVRSPPPRKSLAAGQKIQHGKELPDQGNCKHYRKSHRWFRFSCCNLVYSCPECHDTLTAPGPQHHYAEAAKAQICGYCSKEQPIRAAKTECINCKMWLTGKRKAGTGGYWEGGKGVRDQVKMARNDSRKYRKKIG